MEKKYFKCRDNSLYTKYTKEEIYSLIDPYDFNTIKPFLKEMDYACDEKAYYELIEFFKKKNNNKVLGRFINKMRLFSYKNFGYNDWEEFQKLIADSN